MVSNIEKYHQKRKEEAEAKARAGMKDRPKSAHQLALEKKLVEQDERKERAEIFHGPKAELKEGEVWCGRCGLVFAKEQAGKYAKLGGEPTCPNCHAPISWGAEGKAEDKKDEK